MVKQPPPLAHLRWCRVSRSPVPKCNSAISQTEISELGSADFGYTHLKMNRNKKTVVTHLYAPEIPEPSLFLWNSAGLEISMYFYVAISKNPLGLDGEETFKPLVPSFPLTLSVKKSDPFRSLLASRCSLLSL